ncbi:unnamed protein product [Heterobilharzia americana]|nr:unnamed protein product [Heterobilharzia americana]
MDLLTPDKNVMTGYNSRTHVGVASHTTPGYVPPIIRGLSLEDSVKCTTLCGPKYRQHSCVRVNLGFNDASSLDSIFSQSIIASQKGSTIGTTTAVATNTNDKSNRCKSSTVPSVIKIHLKADAELIAQQITLIELKYFQAIEADEFYTLKWFNQIIFWVQKDILNEKNLSKRTEILSHFIRIAKKLVDINNFSSGMAVVSGLHVQCIYRLNATWSNLSSRDRHTFRKLADLFSQENNYVNLRSAVDNARLPCIPYLGVFLGDLTFIDVAASSVATSLSHRENSSWDSQGKQDRMNNILRIIANFQQSNYPFIRNESVATYLEAQRYIEELQRFIEDANYKLSLQVEPPSPPDPCCTDLPYTIPPNNLFLSSTNNVLKPVPVYNSSTTTVTATTTITSKNDATCNAKDNSPSSKASDGSGTTRKCNKKTTDTRKATNSISPLCDLLAPPAIPPPPPIHRPRKRPTYRRLGSWAGIGMLASDNYISPTIEEFVRDTRQALESGSTQQSTLSIPSSSTSSSQPSFRSPVPNTHMKLYSNDVESTTKQLSPSQSSTLVTNLSSPRLSDKSAVNSKASRQRLACDGLTFQSNPASSSSSSSPQPKSTAGCESVDRADDKQSQVNCKNRKNESLPINLLHIRYESLSPTPSPSTQHTSTPKSPPPSSSAHQNQSFNSPYAISNTKTAPVTPVRGTRDHSCKILSRASEISDPLQKCCTTVANIPISNKNKLSVVKRLFHDPPPLSPSPTVINPKDDKNIDFPVTKHQLPLKPAVTLSSSLSSCANHEDMPSKFCTPISKHTNQPPLYYQHSHCLSQTFPLTLSETKMRCSSFRMPKLSLSPSLQSPTAPASYRQGMNPRYQQYPFYLSHLALAALAAVQVAMTNNDDVDISIDGNIHNPVYSDGNLSMNHQHSPSFYYRSHSSPMSSTCLHMESSNWLEVIREGPLLCCTSSFASFQNAQSHEVPLISTLPTLQPDCQNIPYIPFFQTNTDLSPTTPEVCSVEVNEGRRTSCFSASKPRRKSDFLTDVVRDLSDFNSSPAAVATTCSQFSMSSSMTCEFISPMSPSTSASSDSLPPCNNSHKEKCRHLCENAKSYPQLAYCTTNACKYYKRFSLSRTFYKNKFKNCWAVLIVSSNSSLSASTMHNSNSGCAYLVLFKTHKSHQSKQFIPWSVSSVSSRYKFSKTRKKFDNSPNHFSASRCKVLRIQTACFDNRYFHSLNNNFFGTPVLVLEASPRKPKVYRLVCHTSYNPVCKCSESNSSKSSTYIDQFKPGLTSQTVETQVTSDTHHIMPWTWTIKTARRLRQVMREKINSISKTDQIKCMPSEDAGGSNNPSKEHCSGFPCSHCFHFHTLEVKNF